MPTSSNKNDKRGLASADEETKERVARQGGKASHSGFKNMSEEKQKDIASKGGKATRNK